MLGNGWAGLTALVALTWLWASQISWSGDIPEPAYVPRNKERDPETPADVIPAFAGHAIRRRGWVLRRALLLADVAAFLFAFAAIELAGGSIDLSDPAVWALAAGALGGWVLLAHGYGLYANDEIQA